MNIRKYINAVTLLSLLVGGTSIVAMESVSENIKTKLAEFNDCDSNKLKEFSEKLDTDYDKLITRITNRKNGLLYRPTNLIKRKLWEEYNGPTDIKTPISNKIKHRENTGYLNAKDLFKVAAGYIATEHTKATKSSGTIGQDYWILGPTEATLTAQTGWKIHLSPNILFCSEVLKLVDSLQSELKFKYKVTRSLPLYRLMNTSEFEREYGKFIAIYPKNDQEAREIADKLNELFIKNGLDSSCFLHLPNEFKIYDGIYSRIAFYECDTPAIENEEEFYRTHIGVNPTALKKHAEENKCAVNEYKHPFPALYANGVKVPNDTWSLTTLSGNAPTP